VTVGIFLTAGTGARRFVMSRKQLRAECARWQTKCAALHKELDHVICQLVRAVGDIDVLTCERDAYGRELAVATQRIEEATELTRNAAQLAAENIALSAALANATKVRSLGATDTPSEDELAAAARTVADTQPIPTLDPDTVNTTRQAWKAPPPRPAGTPTVHTLMDAFSVHGATVRITGLPGHTTP
jgi:hypothetical protein